MGGATNVTNLIRIYYLAYQEMPFRVQPLRKTGETYNCKSGTLLPVLLIVTALCNLTNSTVRFMCVRKFPLSPNIQLNHLAKYAIDFVACWKVMSRHSSIFWWRDMDKKHHLNGWYNRNVLLHTYVDFVAIICYIILSFWNLNHYCNCELFDVWEALLVMLILLLYMMLQGWKFKRLYVICYETLWRTQNHLIFVTFQTTSTSFCT